MTNPPPSEAKLFAKGNLGLIEESLDSPSVLDAFQKLDAYKEQISQLLRHSSSWVRALMQSSQFQQSLISQLTESHGVLTGLAKQQPVVDLALAAKGRGHSFADLACCRHSKTTLWSVCKGDKHCT